MIEAAGDPDDAEDIALEHAARGFIALAEAASRAREGHASLITADLWTERQEALSRCDTADGAVMAARDALSGPRDALARAQAALDQLQALADEVSAESASGNLRTQVEAEVRRDVIGRKMATATGARNAARDMLLAAEASVTAAESKAAEAAGALAASDAAYDGDPFTAGKHTPSWARWMATSGEWLRHVSPDWHGTPEGAIAGAMTELVLTASHRGADLEAGIEAAVRAELSDGPEVYRAAGLPALVGPRGLSEQEARSKLPPEQATARPGDRVPADWQVGPGVPGLGNLSRQPEGFPGLAGSGDFGR